jgi:hypothetical protein
MCLQTAFNTVALSMFDWAIVTGVAATLLIGMEVVKFGLQMERRAVLRPCCIATGGHAQCHLCSIDGPFRHLSHWHAVLAALGTVLIPKPLS